MRKHKDNNSVWMLVTDDEYELPLMVADTSKELAEKLGVSANTIRSAYSHSQHRKDKCIYRKVVLTDA